MKLYSLCSKIDENKLNIFFLNAFSNEIYKYIINENKIEYVCSFDEEKISGEILYESMYLYKNNIIMIPENAYKIAILSSDGNKKYIKWNRQPIFKSFKFENIIWCILKDGVIVSFNLDNYEIIEHSQKSGKLKLLTNEISIQSFQLNFINGNIILCRNKKIIEFNIITERSKVYNVPIDKKIYNCMYDGRDYWIQMYSNLDIIKLDRKSGNIEYFVHDDIKWGKLNNIIAYSDVMQIENNIFLTGYYTENVYKIDINSRKIKKIPEFPNEYNERNTIGFGPLFSAMHYVNDQIIFIPFRSDMLLKYDMRNNKLDKLIFQDKNINRVNDSIITMSMDLLKESFFDLNEFLNYVCNKRTVNE